MQGHLGGQDSAGSVINGSELPVFAFFCSIGAPGVAEHAFVPHDEVMSDMTCPKCHGAMRTYERNGVHIDQCSECRGIFLDRGELEHLVSAETRWREAPAAPPPAQSGRPPEPYYEAKGKPTYYKRKKNFLEELFD